MKILLSDTSVLLNLLAGECLQELSRSLDVQFVVCSAVYSETQRLRDPSTGEMVPVDLAALVTAGLLQVVEISSEEEAAGYLAEATVVDDGEAMSIALAAARHLDLAIDDRRATNHVKRKFPELKLWTTPELLEAWTTRDAIEGDRVTSVLRLIEARARYSPSSKHPLFAWWSAKLGR